MTLPPRHPPWFWRGLIQGDDWDYVWVARSRYYGVEEGYNAVIITLSRGINARKIINSMEAVRNWPSGLSPSGNAYDAGTSVASSIFSVLPIPNYSLEGIHPVSRSIFAPLTSESLPFHRQAIHLIFSTFSISKNLGSPPDIEQNMNHRGSQQQLKYDSSVTTPLVILPDIFLLPQSIMRYLAFLASSVVTTGLVALCLCSCDYLITWSRGWIAVVSVLSIVIVLVLLNYFSFLNFRVHLFCFFNHE